jgi:hypothetical protein
MRDVTDVGVEFINTYLGSYRGFGLIAAGKLAMHRDYGGAPT